MQKKFIKRNRKTDKAFTLVELLIAISIMSISILAAFTAISNNLRGSNFAEDQMIAYYLADEGIEYVRNIRDQNSLKNIQAGSNAIPWLDGVSQFCTARACTVDSPLANITSCSGAASTCPYLRKDTVSGLYGYTSSWPLTQFQRGISVNVISATEADVSSTISWTTNGVSKNYTLSEILRDYTPQFP